MYKNYALQLVDLADRLKELQQAHERSIKARDYSEAKRLDSLCHATLTALAERGEVLTTTAKAALERFYAVSDDAGDSDATQSSDLNVMLGREGALSNKLGVLLRQYDLETRHEEKLRLKALIDDTRRELNAVQGIGHAR